MRHLTLPTALAAMLALGAAPFFGSAALAQSTAPATTGDARTTPGVPANGEELDISGLDCDEAAARIMEHASEDTFLVNPDEEQRIRSMVTGAQQNCLQGDRASLDRVARIVEDTRWVNQQGWMAGVD
jgi:hypothetical protein